MSTLKYFHLNFDIRSRLRKKKKTFRFEFRLWKTRESLLEKSIFPKIFNLFKFKKKYYYYRDSSIFPALK